MLIYTISILTLHMDNYGELMAYGGPFDPFQLSRMAKVHEGHNNSIYPTSLATRGFFDNYNYDQNSIKFSSV